MAEETSTPDISTPHVAYDIPFDQAEAAHFTVDHDKVCPYPLHGTDMPYSGNNG